MQVRNNKKCICVGNNKNCDCIIEKCSTCKSCNNIIVTEFEAFMNSHRRKDNGDFTHTSMGKVSGSWNITPVDYPQFMKLYKRFSRKNISSYVERSPWIAPFYFDVDFHIKKQNRYYDDEFIEEIISRLNRIIGEHFVIPDNSSALNAYLFEKFEPSSHDDGGYKDGFHIMYPELPLSVPSRYFVYDKFMEELIKNNFVDEKIPYTNELDKIFDISVIYANGVLMYGAAKDGREPYKLTKVYNEKVKQILPDIYNDEDTLTSDLFDNDDQVMPWEDISTLTFMRRYENDEENLVKPATKMIDTKILDNFKKNHDSDKKKKNKKNNNDSDDSDTDDFEENEDVAKSFKKNKKRSDNITENDIKLAKEIAKILSPKRASSYDTWSKVGWALHNIDDSLYDAFLTFSKKAGKKKYDEKGCYRLWKEARSDGYSIGSLRMWALEDDPEEFDTIIGKLNEEVLEKLASISHDDIANYVYSLYKGLYVCTDITKKEWFEFRHHRWHKIQNCQTLFEKISNEVPHKLFKALNDSKRVVKFINERKDKFTDGEETFEKEVEVKNQLIKRNSKLTDNLKNIPFKKNIIEACSYKFYDSEFKQKLNANVHLLGFNNGVFCIKPEDMGFRDGVPEDYITFTVGYDYIDKPDESILKKIDIYFVNCLQNANIRGYVLRFIASCIDGSSKDQKFPFWIGQTGGNGKSCTIDICKSAFGDYYSNMQVSYLTKARDGSSGAQPDLADKIGKRLITFQESEKGEKLKVGKLKELCGNDTISTRGLYQEQTYFKPQAKYILATNKLPELDIDGGIKRRVRCVEWSTKFRDRDDIKQELKSDPKYRRMPESEINKLIDNQGWRTDPKFRNLALKDDDIVSLIETNEWKQTFMWFLINKIYPDYVKNGLYEPEEVTNLSGKYMASNDRFGKFIDTYTEPCDERSRLLVIYDEFKEFYKQYYSSKTPNLEEFIEYLRSRDYRIDEKGKNNIYIYGMKIKDDEEIQSEVNDDNDNDIDN
jgi:phage/plasmid-associated DNA primase